VEALRFVSAVELAEDMVGMRSSGVCDVVERTWEATRLIRSSRKCQGRDNIKLSCVPEKHRMRRPWRV
jgi:hypothetical protein